VRDLTVKHSSYAFKGQDPVVAALRIALDGEISVTEISRKSGVHQSTIYALLTKTAKRRTKRPQLATVAAIGSVIGVRGYDWLSRELIFSKNSR
jgi:hypothetical protein